MPLLRGGGGRGALRPTVVAWCAARHGAGGVQGRVNKPCDSCYSWWVGASLALLAAEPGGGRLAGALDRGLEGAAAAQFVLSCQKPATGAQKHTARAD